MKTAALIRPLALAALLLTALTGLTGCAGAPVQEMSNARQALKAAEDSGAKVASNEDYLAAEARLKSAEAKLQKRSFRAARHDALEAKALAIRAMEASITADKTPDD